jgi:signal transduction histidine kinase
MEPIIVCVNVDRSLVERLAGEAGVVLGREPAVELCRDAAGARECFRACVAAGRDVPVVAAGDSLPAGEREALFDEVRARSPWTVTILLPGRDAFPKPGVPPGAPGGPAGAASFTPDLIRAVAASLEAKEGDPVDPRPGNENPLVYENPLVEELLRIVGAKAKELEDSKGELEALFKEFNAETIQRLLIEREAEKMSRQLTALQNNLRNNLFIRSVLHSLINMLQVQLSIDKEENAVIREIEEALRRGADGCRETEDRLLPALQALREKTDDNIHKTMTGYAKAVQRSLLGEHGFASPRPTNLAPVVERILAKYWDILSGEKTGKPVRFSVEPAGPEIKIWIYDFALVNVVENLFTNSIRKVLEAERTDRWIRLTVTEERLGPDGYTVLTWTDDSDKTEEGDHGIGLSDVKATVQSAGGFIREEGVPGEGAKFVIGIPKPASSD